MARATSTRPGKAARVCWFAWSSVGNQWPCHLPREVSSMPSPTTEPATIGCRCGTVTHSLIVHGIHGAGARSALRPACVRQE